MPFRQNSVYFNSINVCCDVLPFLPTVLANEIYGNSCELKLSEKNLFCKLCNVSITNYFFDTLQARLQYFDANMPFWQNSVTLVVLTVLCSLFFKWL